MTVTGSTVTASAVVSGGDRPPRLPGFMVSDFAPLVYAAARSCVGAADSRHLLSGAGDRTGIVLGSRGFDTVTLELAVRQVDAGRVSPVLFYQVLPTAVLGIIARDYRLTGPVSCLAVTGNPRAEALELAAVVLADRSADRVLALAVELAEDPADSYACADLVTAEA
ncbi:hypothetical protein Q5425_06995 [Amycolatopsis sp. A133]|uniref:hypothetical protein n=1 Tax=Amycolatopsis sp. A133 TaxID=3064472 RepID=UPI0027F0C4B9|nr:hypothetical protein [Amycolatopsis sp. A133]MDQ7803471.1 hypothetical protein [Amycolatopsis sp. A133]